MIASSYAAEEEDDIEIVKGIFADSCQTRVPKTLLSTLLDLLTLIQVLLRFGSFLCCPVFWDFGMIIKGSKQWS